ncbi:hypothetical protein Cabys_973 [Caldithrix abyssi DSM 13497]|uniref:Uncharacterized protein n=1 Tax=Caldithrix abyssi DSM 13497 TaxID=880073 RepID=A0A1J1C5N3_CALAY|nr:hypothetical protein Cabys_973 [Caldithrix abyssi DSM 13497]
MANIFLNKTVKALALPIPFYLWAFFSFLLRLLRLICIGFSWTISYPFGVDKK